MNESYIKNVVEAAMLAAGRPLQVLELAELFDETNRPTVGEIRAALATLEEDYTGRGIEVKETATGFRIQVRRDLANEVSRLWPERPPKYSRALLETMALIAYRQPITRAEIEAVRGVAVNPNIIKTLLERNWVRVVGQRDVPGRPELLGTTKEFLDYFGLRSLDELPPLAELKAMGDVNLQLDLAKDVVSSDMTEVVPAGVDGEAISISADEVVALVSAETATANVAAHAGGIEIADIADLDALVEAGELHADAQIDAEIEAEIEAEIDAEISVDAPEPVVAEAADSEAAAGPKRRAAEAFVAEIDADDADASGNEDDSSDEDELSADAEGSNQLVASPPRYDD